MTYKLQITKSFENDLDAVLQYISSDLHNPVAAKRMIINVQKKIIIIHENPLLYPLYHDEKFEKQGYHYAIVANYLIFYKIDESAKTIFVERLLYGSQNIVDII